MTDEGNSFKVESFVEQYVGVWRRIFSSPAEFLVEEARGTDFKSVTSFALTNFVASTILALAFVRKFDMIAFPLVLLLAAVFTGAAYLVCLRTLNISADFVPLLKLSLWITAILAIPSAVFFPLLVVPVKLAALALFCIAFMGLFELTLGRAIWAALSPCAFMLILGAYLSIIFHLCHHWIEPIRLVIKQLFIK